MEDNWREILEKEFKDAAIELTSAYEARDKLISIKQKDNQKAIDDASERVNTALIEYNKKWKSIYESTHGPLEVKKSTD